VAATWIVSANASRARFFSQATGTDPLEEIEDMVNEAARLTTGEVETDRMGPTSAGQSIHNTGGAAPNKTYEPKEMPDKRAAEGFARDIADYLLRAHREGRFQQLSLVVSPKFLGALRKFLDPSLQDAVKLEVDKDYTHFGPEELRQHIQVH
jgi:protein required for attachment to host cells